MFRFLCSCSQKRLNLIPRRWTHSGKDFYKVLNLEPDCTADDIRKAFTELSKKYHPDLNVNNANQENADKIIEIIEAYRQLSKTHGKDELKDFAKYRSEEFEQWLAKQADREPPEHTETTPQKWYENGLKRQVVAFLLLIVIYESVVLYREEKKRRKLAVIIEEIRSEMNIDGIDIHTLNLEIMKRVEKSKTKEEQSLTPSQ